jgi:radical SAM superfamily enzyme YgiQ (UPF0313 family)
MFEKVQQLVARGEKTIYFGDDEATYDTLERFARKILAAGLKFRWTINLRFDPRIDLEWARLLRESGCFSMAIGLESYHDRILTLVNKGIDVALIEKCIGEIAWSGIALIVYMIVGLPTETEEEAELSFDRVKKHLIDGDISSVTYSLYGVSFNSPMYLNPSRYGITKLYPVAEKNDLESSLFHFDHSGMSRAKANYLCGKYKSTVADIVKLPVAKFQNIPMEEISCDGASLEVRKDVQEIFERLSF